MASVLALASALVRTFLVIGIGSAAALSGYLDRAAAAGIGQLVAKVCLPALLFKATATADLSSLRLEVVIAVLVAKWTAFVVAALVGYHHEGGPRVHGRRAALTRAAIYGLFVTNSNDIAFGAKSAGGA